VATNLWENPSLESGVDDWNNYVFGVVSQSSTEAWDQTNSLRIAVAARAGIQGGTSDVKYVVEESTQYTISAYIFTTDATYVINFRAYDQDSNLLGAVGTTTYDADTWTRIDFTVTMGAGDTGIKLQLLKDSADVSAGYIYCDGIMLETGASASEWVDYEAGDTDELTANDLTAGTPTLETPAIGQKHVLTASDLTAGTPTLETPTIGQKHALTASDLTAGTPTLGTPEVEDVDDIDVLTASDLTSGTPTLATPTIGQTHVLTAGGLTAGTPTLGAPELDADEIDAGEGEGSITLRDDYEHWARSFPRRMGQGWGDFLDRIKDGTIDDTMWDDVRVAAQATRPGSSSPTWSAFVGAAHTWLFANAQSNYVEFNAQIPHTYKEGTDIYPHVHWGPSNTSAGNVVWRLDYTWADIGGSFPNTTAITVTDAADLTTRKHQVAEFSAIDGTGKGISSMLICKLTRLGSDEGDTYTSGAWFYEFDFHIEMNSLGSDEEYVK
jgi:hypothetical protein